MFITEMDVHGNCVRAEDPASSDENCRRLSISSDVSFSSTDEQSFATAHNSLQRQSSSSAGGSGLGISGYNSRRASAPWMASNSTITAAAAAQGAGSGNWPGGILRQVDIRVESRELDGLDAELRRRSRHLPRDSRWTVAGDHETISELTSFLRNVTPPPSNFMSMPSPTTTTLSSMPSVRRRNSGSKKGALMKMVRLFRRGSKKKVPSRSRSSSKKKKKRPASPPGLARSHGTKRKRSPRIKLPDTAIAGRTVDGHRHIAISIPIEHANLGCESRYGYPPPIRHTRSRSMSSADTSSPRIYDDINYSVHPLMAFVTEPHRGTQLGPLAEERESLSSRSWERGSSNGSGQGEAATARKVRLASRNTFGTVQEEQSRPNTSSGVPREASPPWTSDESGGSKNAGTSDEMRLRAHQQALATLAGGGSLVRPAVGASGQRPVSAHSLRSFAASNPSRVYYPVRHSSLHPSGPIIDARRPRTMSNTTGGTNNSRDSSREQTLQESIFSDRSYLDSLDTVSTENLKEDLHSSPVLVSEATFARRFEGSDVVEYEPRSSLDSQKRRSKENRQSGSSRVSASSREKRTSGSPRPSAIAKGKQREIYEGPVVVRPENRHSGGSVDKGKQKESGDGLMTVNPEKRNSGGSTASTSAVFGQRKSKPAPVVVTRESAAAVASEAKQRTDKSSSEETPTTPMTAGTGRRSKFVEDLAEAPLPDEKEKDHQAQAVGDQQRVQPEGKVKGKATETRDHEAEPPSIEVQQPTPTVAEVAQTTNHILSTDQMISSDLVNMPSPDPTVEDAPVAPSEKSRSRGRRGDEGKQGETGPVQHAEEVGAPSTPDRQRTAAQNTSPIPSPRERRDRRKSLLLSRKERIAELRAALQKPGSQPSDLLWERRLSISSVSSSGASTIRAARIKKERDSFPYAPTALSPTLPRAPYGELSLTKVVTVADVQPSSPPEGELVRKDSIALSVSSPGTVATFIKTSPIPLYRSLGSVTPPDSPTDSLPMHSPSSQFSPVDAHGTPFRRSSVPPVKGRVTRRLSGRTSPSPSSGRRSPVVTLETSPTRPKTAGKGALASKKAFFEARSDTPRSDLAQAENNAGPSTGQGKSILKMSRSEIFDRYEALREKQTRDMERRIRRLERNGEYWLTSMLPILNDVSQTLKIAVGGHHQADKGEGKEVGRDPMSMRIDDSRQSGFVDRRVDADSEPRPKRHREEDVRVRSDDSLDPGEFIVRHSASSPNGRSSTLPVRPRLYLHDDATLDWNRYYYPDERPSTSDGRDFSMINIGRSRHQSRVASLAADPQQYSGSTTMVDSATLQTNSFARPTPKRASNSTHFHDDLAVDAERLARLEKISERINAETRRFPLLTTSPSTTRKSFAERDNELAGLARLDLSADSQESLRTYEGTDTEMSTMGEHWSRQRGDERRFHRERKDGFDTIEPLMRELQMGSSRVSMESASYEDLGDNEVHRMRQGPGPRAVVGFGAFSM